MKKNMFGLKRKMKKIFEILMCFAMVVGALLIPIEAKAQHAEPRNGEILHIDDGTSEPFGREGYEYLYVEISKDEVNSSLGWTQNLRVYLYKNNENNYYMIKWSDDMGWWVLVEDGKDDVESYIRDFKSWDKSNIDDMIDNENLALYWFDDEQESTSVSAPISGPDHVHSWTHGIIYEPTEETDGLEGECCSCGAQRNTVAIPATFALIENRYQEIEQAISEKDTILEMKSNYNFSQAFMKKLA